MRVLGLIPARAGSIRIPRKNMADLGGKPLIGWTIDVAQAATRSCLDRLVVSTDSTEITAYAIERDIEVHRRPELLAGEDVQMIDVVRDLVAWADPTVIVLLQPTSPFRTVEDVEHCCRLLRHNNGDAVVSVVDAPSDLVFQIGHAQRMRQRDDIVVPNGAVYVITTDSMMRGGDWYSGTCYAHRMPKDRSLDIDTPLDLEVARMMVAQRAYA